MSGAKQEGRVRADESGFWLWRPVQQGLSSSMVDANQEDLRSGRF